MAVLPDEHAEGHPFDRERCRLRSGLEVPQAGKRIVTGKNLSMISTDDPAAMKQTRGVMQGRRATRIASIAGVRPVRGVGPHRMTDQQMQVQILRRCLQRLQCLVDGVDKRLAPQQIAARVAGQRALRRDQQLRAGQRGVPRQCDDARPVADRVAGHRVELCRGDPHGASGWAQGAGGAGRAG